MNDEPQPRRYRVSLAHMVFAEIQVDAVSPAAARELAMQNKTAATRKFATDVFHYRTEQIARMVDGVPVWEEAV